MRAEVFWKQVCDCDLPDFDAVERAVLAMPVPAKRPRGVLWAAAALALVVLAAGAVGLLSQGGTGSLAPQTPEPVLSAPATEKKAEKEPEEAAEEEPQVPEVPADVVVFNEMGDEMGMALDVGMAEFLESHAQLWTLEQILDYWGFNPLPEVLPEGVRAEFDEDSTWKYAAADGLVWDQFAFPYGDGLDVYDPLEKKLSVTVAGDEILQFGINFSDEDLKASKISGVEMWLGEREVGYGPYTDGPDGAKVQEGYYPLMEADFQWNGLYFRVVAENLTESQFVAVLKDMVE